MAKTNNKLQFQSYIFTTAKYDFSVYEKRILYRMIEIEQRLINQEALDKAVKIEANLWGDKKYTVPMSLLLSTSELDDTTENRSKNNNRFIKAFSALQDKKVVYEDSEVYGRVGVIDKFEFKKNERFVSWKADSKIIEMITDFSKGWRMYELKIAFNMQSQYSMRFYELIANKTKKISYKMSDIIKMFSLENTYLRTGTKKHNYALIELRVIKKAQEELDRVSPYTFTYKLSEDYAVLDLFPVYQPQFASAKYKRENKTSEISLEAVMSENEKEIYLNEFGFSEQGLKNNYALFEELKKTFPANFEFFLFQTIREALKKNPKAKQGFIIGIIKNTLNDYKNNQNGTKNKRGI